MLLAREENQSPPDYTAGEGVGEGLQSHGSGAGASRTHSAGERLEAGLTRDRMLREARTRSLQEKIEAYYRLEKLAGQVAAVSLLVFLIGAWFVFSIQWRTEPPVALQFVMAVVLVGSLIAFPAATALAMLAGARQSFLLRSAANQHLLVHDPGRPDPKPVNQAPMERPRG